MRPVKRSSYGTRRSAAPRFRLRQGYGATDEKDAVRNVKTPMR
jgi:hypothetical protein